jgi:hypothetical protein
MLELIVEAHPVHPLEDASISDTLATTPPYPVTEAVSTTTVMDTASPCPLTNPPSISVRKSLGHSITP